MNRLIIVGSPRTDGRSAHLADLLFESCIDECPDDELALAPVSTLAIEPCQGCDACKALAACAASGGASDGETAEEACRRCVIDDDMAEVYELIDAADELVVVSPVYFAGAPAQLKALLDRLQPYYFTDLRTRPKRPAVIHVVGAGGDPHGFEPLIGTVRSALSVAGFAVELVLDWVGKIRADGEITADAEEYPLPPVGGFGAMGLDFDDDYEVVEVEGTEEIEEIEEAEGDEGVGEVVEPRPKDRAKLSVSQKAPAPKQGAPKSGSRGPRKSSGKGGGPAYGKKNTKKKGNGRGGHR